MRALETTIGHICLSPQRRHVHRPFELGGGGRSSVCHSSEDKEGKFAIRFWRRGVLEGVDGSSALACSTTFASCIDIEENLR